MRRVQLFSFTTAIVAAITVATAVHNNSHHHHQQHQHQHHPTTITLPECTDLACVLDHVLAHTPLFLFDHPEWSINHWNYYVLQDVKYLLVYNDIVAHMAGLCTPDDHHQQQQLVDAATLDALTAVLSLPPTFDAPSSEARYEIPAVADTPPSRELQDYLSHYFAQTSCEAMLSAMLPCLCVYPPLYTAVQQRAITSNAPLGVRNLIDDNIAIGMAACDLVTSVVDGCKRARHRDVHRDACEGVDSCADVEVESGRWGESAEKAFLYSLHLELRFFHQTPPQLECNDNNAKDE